MAANDNDAPEAPQRDYEAFRRRLSAANRGPADPRLVMTSKIPDRKTTYHAGECYHHVPLAHDELAALIDLASMCLELDQYPVGFSDDAMVKLREYLLVRYNTD